MKLLSARYLLLIYVPSVCMLAAIAVLSAIGDIETHEFTRDIASIANVHPLTGALSNLGMLLWCAAAAICLFSGVTGWSDRPRDMSWFLICSALVSSWLLFDDLFLFHEILGPQYLGIHESIIFVTLGVIMSVYLLAFRRVILRTHCGLLLLALVFLTGSLVIDKIFEPLLRSIGHWEGLLEDGAKWLGIVSWCTYFTHTSGRHLQCDCRVSSEAAEACRLRATAAM